VYRVKLSASGRAAHSSLPELGESAIEKLLDALTTLRRVEWPDDPVMGRTHYTVGLIGGGVAPNVIPASADAEVMFRTVGDVAEIRRLLEASIGSLVRLDDVLVVPPVRLKTVDGFDSAAFSFTTDIPWLDRWGTPLLLGPGSITVAHTDHEHVAIAELHRAAELYESLARTLMSHSGA
jgi:acetylornithine deacetylase